MKPKQLCVIFFDKKNYANELRKTFDTTEEKDAYLAGLSDAVGWDNYEIQEEETDNNIAEEISVPDGFVPF